MMDWLTDPVVLRYGKAITSGNDLAVSWVALVVGIFYFPLAAVSIKQRFINNEKDPDQLLFIGILLTAAGIGLLRLYWSIWRALPDGPLKDNILLIGNYTSSIVGLSLLGYTFHLRTLWVLSGRSGWSYVCFLVSVFLVFVLGFWNTIRA